MLNDELSIWQPYLERLKSGNLHFADQTDDEFQKKLKENRKQITEAWLNVTFSETPEVTMGRYFRFQQQEIKWFIAQAEELNVSSEKRPLVSFLLNELRELQDFLKRHFLRYLIPDELLEALTDKVLVNLSVAQLGCILKLAYEAGLFPNITVAELIRTVVLYCRTRKQPHISAKSLSKEYYGVEQVTAATCRELFEQLIKRIDKLYFT